MLKLLHNCSPPRRLAQLWIAPRQSHSPRGPDACGYRPMLTTLPVCKPLGLARVCAKCSDASHRPGVLRHHRIRGQQGDAFDNRLCDQDAVERIFVKWWQGVDGQRVFATDRQLDIPVIQQPAAQQSSVDQEIVATEAALDGDFPQAGGAEDKFVVGRFNQCTCCGRESVRLPGRP